MKIRPIFFWILAVIITLSASIYQRRTGPTYEKRVEINIDSTDYKFELLRSFGGEEDCKIELIIPETEIRGILEYRKFPTNDDWTTVKMTRQGETISAELPNLPPAGKYEYKIILSKNGTDYPLNNGEPVVIRFKGEVPSWVLIPHIFFIFFAMFLGNLAGVMAIFRYEKFRYYTNLTVIALFIGGLIFGPWVQLYAFNELWAGVPFAWDLTDNKTLVAFLFWLLAYFMNRKKESPVYTVVAAIVMLLVYSIPHSMYGSQLDPETGEMIQGWIWLFIF